MPGPTIPEGDIMSFQGMGHNRPPEQKRDPDCLCITCGEWFHHLGIMSHRAAHRRRKERCEIEFSDGRVVDYRFDKSN